MATEAERKAIWDSLLESDFQKRYWHAKAGSFVKIDRRLQIFLAILSSAAVLTALDDLEMQYVWKWLSAATAIVATALPFLNFTRRSVAMTDIASKWHALEVEYSAMWRSIDRHGFSEQRFKELQTQEVEIGKAISELPTDDKKLQSKCYEQVFIARGIHK